jgi:hypothetical protein
VFRLYHPQHTNCLPHPISFRTPLTHRLGQHDCAIWQPVVLHPHRHKYGSSFFKAAPFLKRCYVSNHTASHSHYDSSQTVTTAAVNLTRALGPPSAHSHTLTHTQAAPTRLLPKEATCSFHRSRALSIFILRLHFRHRFLTRSLGDSPSNPEAAVQSVL